MPRKTQRTTREAIIHVLSASDAPMKTKDVVEAVIPLATSLKSKTKAHTIYTTMLSESKKINGAVVQVKPGLYRARRQDEILTDEQVARKQKALARKAAAAAATESAPAPRKNARKRQTRVAAEVVS